MIIYFQHQNNKILELKINYDILVYFFDYHNMVISLSLYIYSSINNLLMHAAIYNSQYISFCYIHYQKLNRVKRKLKLNTDTVTPLFTYIKILQWIFKKRPCSVFLNRLLWVMHAVEFFIKSLFRLLMPRSINERGFWYFSYIFRHVTWN